MNKTYKLCTYIGAAVLAVAVVVCTILYGVGVMPAAACVGVVVACAVIAVAAVILIVVFNKKLFRHHVRKMSEATAEGGSSAVTAGEYEDELLLDTLTKNTGDVYVMLSGDEFEVEYVSPNVTRVLGVNRDDVTADIINIGKAHYLDDKEVTLETIAGVKLGGSLSVVSSREHLRNKERKYFTETIYHVKAEGKHKFIIEISDRTNEFLARQSLEEALNIAKTANQSKSTFLANMSRDIRTPMNTIVGLCTLLNRDVENVEKRDEHIKNILLTSRHMLTLVNDIIEMAKVESNDTALNITDVKIDEIVKEINAKATPLVKAKNQSFKTIVATKDEKFVGDKVRIKRVMMNIISNAVKYTPEGGQIEFVIQQMARPSRKYMYLQFIVKDNGIGMSEEFQQRVFEPFTRENTHSSETEGTGLGMAIAKNIVDLMGGTITVQSKKNAGTTFTVSFKFPLSKISDTSFWIDQGITRILVVGGNNIDNNSVTWAMRKTEVTTSFAKNIKAAKASIDKALQDGKGYNMILCDWHGENEPCLTMIRELRSVLPEYVPIVVFGECEWSEIADDAIRAGANAHLAKPFVVTAFKDCVLNLKATDADGVVYDVRKKSNLMGMRFLAAEDNELNSMVLCELLNMVGASCVVKPNGQEALEEFVNSPQGFYDGVLMDVQMPVMDGYEATRAIRACDHSDAKIIPIIAMTANAFTEDIQKATEAGMNAYLLKPIDMNKLEETVAGFRTE